MYKNSRLYSFAKLVKIISLKTIRGDYLFRLLRAKPEVLKIYTGKYQVSQDYIAEITLANNTLFLQINNEPKLKLSAEKENLFFIKEEDITVEFTLNQNNIFELKIKEGLSTKTGDKIQ